MSLQDQPSADTKKHSPSRMTLVGEKRLPDSPLPSSTTTTIPSPTTTQLDFQKEVLTRAAWRASVLGALNVITAVLAVRLIVLVSVAGGIWLAFIALQNPDEMRLGVLGIYSAVIVVPVIWLASRR